MAPVTSRFAIWRRGPGAPVLGRLGLVLGLVLGLEAEPCGSSSRPALVGCRQWGGPRGAVVIGRGRVHVLGLGSCGRGGSGGQNIRDVDAGAWQVDGGVVWSSEVDGEVRGEL